MSKEPILVSWSGGKDCALALREVLAEGRYEVTLLSTVTDGLSSVSMHGVHERLIDLQAQALSLPIIKARVPLSCPGDEYARIMGGLMRDQYRAGVRKVVFGDIFLEDVRRYREQNLARVDMTGVFPLWKKDSRDLAQTFLHDGFHAVVVCVDTQVLDPLFCGQLYDQSFLGRLPPGVDPCGENGEFHSFTFDGPMFRGPIAYSTTRVALRDSPDGAPAAAGRFAYCDLLPD